MTERRCPVCRNNPITADRYVCSQCATKFRANLTDLPSRLDALQAAIGNQLQFGPQYREGGINAETQLPFDQHASNTAQAAKHAILQWTHHTAQARQEFTPTTWHEVARYLDVRAHWIATQATGPDAYRAINRAIHNITQTIDRPRYRHIPLHIPCTYTTTDNDPCPGSYQAILDDATIRDLTCTHDPDHVVAPAEFRTLRRTIDPTALTELLHR